MSKVIYICFKDPSRCNAEMERKMETIINRITADNITPRPPNIVSNGNVIYGIVNPANSIKENGESVLLGMAYGDHSQWSEPGSQIPDGSFSIFRSGGNKTEVLTDIVGSRTVWYYHDEEVFVASSSQRAIVMLLGNFELNKAVIPWMLSTGSLGPSLSWDARIKLLPPDTSILLDHIEWSLSVNSRAVEFILDDVPDKDHEDNMVKALKDTFRSLNIDFNKWILPLSGGYDSRGILTIFNSIGANLEKIKAITWGIKSAMNQEGNDAFIAKKLAIYYKTGHKYYLTDFSDEPIGNIFQRFLICGEGRIDHISGYMDGFNIWKKLFLDGNEGIIRGDVSFTTRSSDSKFDILKDIPLYSDYSNLKDYQFDVKQVIPENLQRRDNESIQTWRDRFYQQFRIPIVLAALNDLKLPYVESINPLLSRRIVLQTRRLPDHLRAKKTLFKKIVNLLGPEIPFANTGANADTRLFLKSNEAVTLFKSELNSQNCRSILPQDFTNYLLQNLKATEGYVHKKPTLKILLLKYLPKWLKNKAKRLNAGQPADINILAFRTYIICKMNETLLNDSLISSSHKG